MGKGTRKNHHYCCGFCNKSDNRCKCAESNALSGKVAGHVRNKFIRFIHRDGRRRYLTDCLDVDLIADWGRSFIIAGGSVACVIMGVYRFRFLIEL